MPKTPDYFVGKTIIILEMINRVATQHGGASGFALA